MTMLRLDHLQKTYGATRVLHNLSLAVPSGQTCAVLGPSGCGKTTLLRLIAGFERADGGSIAFNKQLVESDDEHVPPEKRRVGIVPQEGALFPHLNVAANVGYGLSRAERKSGRVEHVLSLVGLTGFEQRMPHELSGGQQQRVAVARALAPRPAVVLLDEPFSSLDAPLRASVRADVRRAIDEDGATAVLVTHDQDEALSMADLVAVMRDGAIAQAAEPTEIYTRPVDIEVGRFVGDAVTFPACQVTGGLALTPLGGVKAQLRSGDLPPDGDYDILLRPEQVHLSPSPHSSSASATLATIIQRRYFGHDIMLTLQLTDGMTITSRVTPRDDYPVGSHVTIDVGAPALTYA